MCFLLMMFFAKAQLLATTFGVDGDNGLLNIPSNESLAHCSSSCGNVSGISYPFGIGPGCFRRGFELTCNNTAQPPTLYIGSTHTRVIAIYSESDFGLDIPLIGFNVTMRPNVHTYIRSWKSPAKGFIIGNWSILYVVGCGVEVYLLDHHTNETMGSCMTLCSNDLDMMEKQAGGNCNGIGCCTINTTRELQGFQLRFFLQDANITQQFEWMQYTKAFLTYDDSYVFSTRDLVSGWINESSIDGTTTLYGNIMDQPNCQSASLNNATYACSGNAECWDADNGGYYCYCPDANPNGNPYAPYVCTDGT
ncbi:hypothetical protein ABZP36_031678 [Zizania latifolia]